jgi:hypothetical protein
MDPSLLVLSISHPEIKLTTGHWRRRLEKWVDHTTIIFVSQPNNNFHVATSRYIPDIPQYSDKVR